MDTLMERARVGRASARARHGLTETKLRELLPSERAYKVSDGGNGLYVVVSPSGSRSFRYDYRLSGRRETLTIGRHEPVARHVQRSHLAYGMDVTLEEARLLLARARVDVSSGRSPARAKVEQRSDVADAMNFGRWATRYFEFKSDAKSGAERLADSTLALRRSIYDRILVGPFGKLNLDEIKPVALGELLDRVKTERGPGPAVHARELVLQVYRFANGKGVDIANPAEALARKAYVATAQQEGTASIVNVSSVFGQVASVAQSGYSAAKGGITILTKSVAAEFARAGTNVRVNSLHPGPGNTPLLANGLAELLKEGILPSAEEATKMVLSLIPNGRLTEPDDVANTILFLCSDMSRNITGAAFNVDGGYTAV